MNPVLVFDKFGPLARRGVQGRSSYAPGECLLKPVNNLKGQKAGLRCGSRLLPIAKPWANRCTVRALAASPSSNSGDASNPKARANSNPKGGKPPSPSPSPPSPKSSPPAAKTPAGSKDGSGKAAGSKGAADAAKSSEYSEAMQKRMGDPSLVYRHEAGMNYAVVLPDIMVGSCPQGPEDVDHLREECNVGAIMCLQEDINFAYFNIDIAAIRQRAEQRGDVKHLRVPIADFDPFSLRMNLPKAVAVMHAAMQQFKPGERVYIHCTAGLGRAPGLALAYMMMMRGLTLKEANEKLQAVRPCGPKLDAIRWATVDMLLPRSSSTEVTLSWSRGVSETCELSGLDVGWGPVSAPIVQVEGQDSPCKPREGGIGWGPVAWAGSAGCMLAWGLVVSWGALSRHNLQDEGGAHGMLTDRSGPDAPCPLALSSFTMRCEQAWWVRIRSWA
eukprot:jgi/Mesvir1/23444/Mv22298-RA.2